MKLGAVQVSCDHISAHRNVHSRQIGALCTDLEGKGGRILHNFGVTPHYRPKFSEYLS